MSLIRKHGAVLQAWACLDLVSIATLPLDYRDHLTSHHRQNARYFRCPVLKTKSW